MPRQMLRIIDANCNRIGEGLRVLEDIARFVLNDAQLTQKLKRMRHSLVKSLGKLGIGLLTERNSIKDVGAEIEVSSQQQDLPSLIRANAKRVQEALRVMEELAKLPDISLELESKDFEQGRFDLYALEQEILSKILRREKAKRVDGLYVIIDTQTLGQRDEVEAVNKVLSGGARVIQLRDKCHDKSDLLVIAQKLKDLCRKSDVLFIINDHLDIALAVDADGLHIGQKDLPLSVVRKELPIDKIVGISTSTLSQAQKAEAEGADYIAVGAIFSTPTKKHAKVVGLEHLRHVRQNVSIPIVAIGGITKQNVAEVIAAGANAIGVISAVISQEDMETAARQLVREIEKKAKGHKKP